MRYRDTQHLLNIGLTLWFWLTPVVYPSGYIYLKLEPHPVLLDLFLANPMTVIVMGFQRALYRFPQPPGADKPVLPPVSLEWLALVVGAVTIGSLLAWRTFFHLSGDFAEEL